MDDIDRANEHAANSLAISLLQQQHKAAQDARNNSGFCLDCDIAIPAERLQILPHCCRCLECQRAHELENKRYA